jgi:hypothetical protein
MLEEAEAKHSKILAARAHAASKKPSVKEVVLSWEHAEMALRTACSRDAWRTFQLAGLGRAQTIAIHSRTLHGRTLLSIIVTACNFCY